LYVQIYVKQLLSLWKPL